MVNHSSTPPHCLTGESYFEKRGCLMNNLTLAGYVRPIASRNIGRYLIEYLTFSKTFAQELLPGISKESEELCSSAGVQGAGPLASAERAASPSAEGWRELETRGRERIAMHGSLPLVSASDPDEFGMQRWSECLSVPFRLVPLIIEGDQQACTKFLHASPQGPRLGSAPASPVSAFPLTEDLCRRKIRSLLQPGADLFPDTFK